MGAKEWSTELLHRINAANGNYFDYIALNLDEAKQILLLLQEYAKMQEHENLTIPERCGECQSMRTMLGPLGPIQYCGSPSKLSVSPQQDISTAEVSPFGRPDWCPLVKTQKILDEMPPEKREKADMMMRGLKAMFGIKDEG